MNRYEQIYDMLDDLNPEVIMEIGTWNGQNAARMMKSCKAKKYIGFDVFEDCTKDLREAEYHVKADTTLAEADANLEEWDHELIQGNSRQTVPDNADRYRKQVDFCFIDGGHSVGTIKSDLQSCLAYMKPHGTIIIDDYYYNIPDPTCGTQNVMAHTTLPYTVLPRADKVGDRGLVKLIKIDMRDVLNIFEYEEESMARTWRFNLEKGGEAGE